MKIDRHNYEEFFILYLDNELDNKDRHEVEAFVAHHPDLKEELEQLLQTKVSPDDSIVFDGKQGLVRTEELQTIQPDNYEEWLLLYIDNELTPAHRRTVEAFIAASPAAKSQLETFRNTVSQPEEKIVFAHKESLYRQEEQPRVIVITWRRIAIAASLLLLFSVAGYFLLRDKQPEAGFANSDKPSKKITPIIETPKDKLPANNTSETAAKNNVAIDPVKEEQLAVTKEVKTPDLNEAANNPKKEVKDNRPIEETQQLATVEEKKDNNLPRPNFNPNVNNTGNDPTTEIAQLTRPVKEETLTKTPGINSIEGVTDFQPAAFNPKGTAIEDEPVIADSGKKNKLRGFFRKITRTFEKTTNIKATDDQDRLLVGGLAIRL